MTTSPSIGRLFAEADFRKQVEKAGPLDLVVEPEAAAEAAALAQKSGLQALLDVIALDPEATGLPAALAPQATAAARPVWVFSPKREERMLARLEAAGSRPVQGFYRDIYGAANAGGRGQRQPPVSAAVLNAYALVCTARSGSTYLCELLAANRGGNPKEHLRPPVLDMLSNAPGGSGRQAAFLDAVLRHGQRDGVFGTKLIAHFCKAARSVVDLDALARAIGTFGAFRILYLIRNDKVLQAISTERAQQTNIYHIRTEAVAQTSARAEYVYDFEAIRSRLALLHREEDEVQATLARLPYPVQVVDYEALVGDPEGRMRRILDFLGIVRSQVSTGTRVMKISNEDTDLVAERFCQEHEQRTGTPARRFFVSDAAAGDTLPVNEEHQRG